MNQKSPVGMHERHLQRKDGSPLFAFPATDYSADEYLSAQQRDNEEIKQFYEEMRRVIQQAIELDPNVESEVVLELRAHLDQLYTRCSAFGSNCDEHKQNIRKLIDIVMKAVWQAASDDPQARKELEQEERARQQHYRLLEYPLVADLLIPNTPIAANELVPTLLIARSDELEAALWLFEPDHLRQLSNDAKTLVENLSSKGIDVMGAKQNMQMIEAHLNG